MVRHCVEVIEMYPKSGFVVKGTDGTPKALKSLMRMVSI